MHANPGIDESVGYSTYTSRGLGDMLWKFFDFCAMTRELLVQSEALI